MKVYKQIAGAKLAIGIEGTREEAEHLFCRIHNWGGTGEGELHSMSEKDGKGFYYFFAPERAVFRALVEGVRLRKSLRGELKKWKKNPRGACLSCMMAAGREMRNWTVENFLPQNPLANSLRRVLDGGAPDYVPEFEN